MHQNPEENGIDDIEAHKRGQVQDGEHRGQRSPVTPKVQHFRGKCSCDQQRILKGGGPEVADAQIEAFEELETHSCRFE